MQNDKVFIAYALTLILGIMTVVTAAIWIGTGSFPALFFIVEHVGLGILIRASYKSFDGPYGLFSKETPETAEVAEPAGSFGHAADPVS